MAPSSRTSVLTAASNIDIKEEAVLSAAVNASASNSSPQNTQSPQTNSCCHVYTHANPGPDSIHTIPLYIAGRATNALLPLVLLAIGLVAEFEYDRGKWLNPILTPAFVAFGVCCYDLFRIYWFGDRIHAYVRVLYDGLCISTGLAVASGFLTSWAIKAAKNTDIDPDTHEHYATRMGWGVSAPIIAFMHLMASIELFIGIDGVIHVLKQRNARKAHSFNV